MDVKRVIKDHVWIYNIVEVDNKEKMKGAIKELLESEEFSSEEKAKAIVGIMLDFMRQMYEKTVEQCKKGML